MYYKLPPGISYSNPPLPLHKCSDPHAQHHMGDRPGIPCADDPELGKEDITKPQNKQEPYQIHDHNPTNLKANILEGDKKIVDGHKKTGCSDDSEQVKCRNILLPEEAKEKIPKEEDKDNCRDENHIDRREGSDQPHPQVDPVAPLNEEGGAHRIGDNKDETPDGIGNKIEGSIIGAEEAHDKNWHYKFRQILEEARKIVQGREAKGSPRKLPVDPGTEGDIAPDYYQGKDGSGKVSETERVEYPKAPEEG